MVAGQLPPLAAVGVHDGDPAVTVGAAPEDDLPSVGRPERAAGAHRVARQVPLFAAVGVDDVDVERRTREPCLPPCERASAERRSCARQVTTPGRSPPQGRSSPSAGRFRRRSRRRCQHRRYQRCDRSRSGRRGCKFRSRSRKRSSARRATTPGAMTLTRGRQPALLAPVGVHDVEVETSVAEARESDPRARARAEEEIAHGPERRWRCPRRRPTPPQPARRGQRVELSCVLLSKNSAAYPHTEQITSPCGRYGSK